MTRTKRPSSRKPSSSPDYPLYERMKTRSPRAAAFWMAGDRLYHLGLLLTMMAIPLQFIVYTQWGPGENMVWSGGFFLASIAVAAAGIYLKRESYKMALKAGIDINP